MKVVLGLMLASMTAVASLAPSADSRRLDSSGDDLGYPPPPETDDSTQETPDVAKEGADYVVKILTYIILGMLGLVACICVQQCLCGERAEPAPVASVQAVPTDTKGRRSSRMYQEVTAETMGVVVSPA